MCKFSAVLHRFFCYIESCGIKICHFLTWLFLQILNPGHSLLEVKEQQMFHGKPEKSHQRKQLDITNETAKVSNNTVQMIYTAGRSLYQSEIDRGQIIDEKNKVLLTVAALLLAAIAFLAPNIHSTWLILIPLSPIIISIYLIITHFGVQSIEIPDWKAVKPCKEEDEIKLKLADEYFKCGDLLGPKNDYKVGIYRASSRAIRLGLFMMVLLFFNFTATFTEKQISPKQPPEVQAHFQQPHNTNKNPEPNTK